MKIRVISLLALILFIFVTGFLWYEEGTKAVDPQNGTSKIFIVKKGEGLKEIAKNLKKESLIRDPLTFFILIRLRGITKDIQAGDFRLSSAMTAEAIAQKLTHGTLDVWITTLEGWRNEEIAMKLAQELAIPENQFLKEAKEGYMFPDTYLLPRQATASTVAKIMQNNFNKRVDQALINQSKNVEMPISEVIILASIVEREARHDEDRPIVAAILLKRFKNDWPLQADATIQYALEYQPQEHDWWKRQLTPNDLKIDSPYNTYINKGLPPAPICNPGIASIKAVLNPAETPYWFYLSDETGKMHYSETVEEHNRNVDFYLK